MLLSLEKRGGGFLSFHFVKLAALTSLIKEKYYRN